MMEFSMLRRIFVLMAICSTASSLRCFVCNSGNSVEPNFACPAEGWVDATKTQLKECAGKCYIKTAVWNTGAVLHRGCVPHHVLPRHLPIGCNIYGGDIWCLCDEDGCNAKRLGENFEKD